MAVPRGMTVTKESIFVVEYVTGDKQVFTGFYRDRLEALDAVYTRAVEPADSAGEVIIAGDQTARSMQHQQAIFDSES